MDADAEGDLDLLAVQPLSGHFSEAARHAQRPPTVIRTREPLVVLSSVASLSSTVVVDTDLNSGPVGLPPAGSGSCAPILVPNDITGSHFIPGGGTDLIPEPVAGDSSAADQADLDLSGHAALARRAFQLKCEKSARLLEQRRQRFTQANPKWSSASSFTATIVGNTAVSVDPCVSGSAAVASPPASEASSGNSTSRSSSRITSSPESGSENHDVAATSGLASTDTAAAVAAGAPPRLSANTTRRTGSSAAPRSFRLHAVQSSLFAYPSGDGWDLVTDCSCGGSVCRSILSSNDALMAADAVADSAVTPESFVLMAASQGVSACNFDARRSPFRIGPEVVVDVPSFIRGTSPAPCSVTRLAAGNRPAVIMSGIAGVINISTEFVAAFRRRSCGWTSPLRIFVADSPLC